MDVRGVMLAAGISALGKKHEGAAGGYVIYVRKIELRKVALGAVEVRCTHQSGANIVNSDERTSCARDVEQTQRRGCARKLPQSRCFRYCVQRAERPFF